VLTVCIQEQVKKSDQDTDCWWHLLKTKISCSKASSDWYQRTISDTDCWWHLLKTKISYSKTSSDWSQRTISDQGTKVIWRITQARMLINVRLISSCLEGVQESLYFFVYSYRFLCQFCRGCVEVNNTHKEKVFLEKVWNIISRSGTEINVLAVPTQKHGSYLVFEFPKPCELWVTQEFMEYLMTWDFRKKYLSWKRFCENISLPGLRKDLQKKYFKDFGLILYSSFSWRRFLKQHGFWKRKSTRLILYLWDFLDYKSKPCTTKRFFDFIFSFLFMLKLGFAQIIYERKKYFIDETELTSLREQVFGIFEWAFQRRENLILCSVIIQSLGKIIRAFIVLTICFC